MYVGIYGCILLFTFIYFFLFFLFLYLFTPSFWFPFYSRDFDSYIYLRFRWQHLFYTLTGMIYRYLQYAVCASPL